jgi:hypothetical protein
MKNTKDTLSNIAITLLIAFNVFLGLLLLLYFFLIYDKFQNPNLQNLDWESYFYIGIILILSFAFTTYQSIRIWKKLDN